MNSAIGGLVAFGLGLVLAGATAFGVVQSQQSSGSAPVNTSSETQYGSNG